MLQGHKEALAAARDGRKLEWQHPSQYYGYRRVLDTLRRWGALDNEGKLTDIGRALLSADNQYGKGHGNEHRS